LFGVYALGAAAVVALAFFASLRMKRHTVWEFIVGALISLFALLIALLSAGGF
jgi:hypothetical protein